MKLDTRMIEAAIARARTSITANTTIEALGVDLLEANAEMEELRTSQGEAILEVARLRIELDDFADREKGSADGTDKG